MIRNEDKLKADAIVKWLKLEMEFHLKKVQKYIEEHPEHLHIFEKYKNRPRPDFEKSLYEVGAGLQKIGINTNIEVDDGYAAITLPDNFLEIIKDIEKEDK